jgi:hypothetical protein
VKHDVVKIVGQQSFDSRGVIRIAKRRGGPKHPLLVGQQNVQMVRRPLPAKKRFHKLEILHQCPKLLM